MAPTLIRLGLAALALLLAALGWRHRDDLGGLLRAPPAAAPAAAISFDNGSVRQPAAPPAPGAAAVPGPPPGGVRKCRRPGGELVYTDGRCPPGSREQALGGGAVNTVSATESGWRPAKPPAEAPGPALREQIVERAVHGTR